MLSLFEMFKAGVGPSSSHTVGPMVAARRFALELASTGLDQQTTRIEVKLYGSLAATGRGHGSDRAILAGLAGCEPAHVDPAVVMSIWADTSAAGALRLASGHEVPMHPESDVKLYRGRTLPGHPNAMTFHAFDGERELVQRTYYSIGGGFIQRDDELGSVADALPNAPHRFTNMAELLELCAREGKSIGQLVLENEESAGRSETEVIAGVLDVWHAMEACVERGMVTEGVLPGGLKVPRRAPGLVQKLDGQQDDALSGLDWLTAYAMAVNEENAAGGRVVTAPTNGAAGVIPAVLYYLVHHDGRHLTHAQQTRNIVCFLLTAAATGMIIKMRASISGAEAGCQAEVGSACAMAAAGLVAYRGGTPHQVENAAEIAMEHSLGLTCDPIGGLVQIPCIERNGVAASHAVSAARAALHGDGTHLVTFDQVVETMRQTGLDMRSKYRETSRGGLAVNTTLC